MCVTLWIRTIDTFMIRRANIQNSDWMEKGICSRVRGSNQSSFNMQMSAGCEGNRKQGTECKGAGCMPGPIHL